MQQIAGREGMEVCRERKGEKHGKGSTEIRGMPSHRSCMTRFAI